ncbi:alkaline phytoceramidase [Candidatus Peregrinibacteria bacterium]|nr:alkaline phytoceramidase [Candidatus Peregrinibacteria bacterium]
MRLFTIVGIGFVGIAVLFFLSPIHQELSYHQFADARRMFGVPNFLNVVSNLPFFIAGICGLLFLLGLDNAEFAKRFRERWERLPFIVFFSSVFLTGIGSSYYHWEPNNSTLFWDRLPLTLVFMSIFGIVIIERIGARVGARIFPLLILVGIASVVTWRLTDDLRFYGFVQFYPIVAIILMLLLFPPRYTRTADFFAVIGWYILSKVCELMDAQIYSVLGIVSGHSIKHLLACAATFWILRMIKLRRQI